MIEDTSKKKYASIFDEDYEESSGFGDYLNMPKDGNCIRILLMDTGVVGWSYWNNQDRPVKTLEQLASIPDPQKPDTKQKRFSVFPVWDIESESFKLLEVTQKSVRQWILDTQRQGEYDLLEGDTGIRITAKGSGLTTKYECVTTSIKAVPGTKQAKLEAVEAEAKRIKELWAECLLSDESWKDSVFTPPESIANPPKVVPSIEDLQDVM
jgi:hypothetical protein